MGGAVWMEEELEGRMEERSRRREEMWEEKEGNGDRSCYKIAF